MSGVIYNIYIYNIYIYIYIYTERFGPRCAPPRFCPGPGSKTWARQDLHRFESVSHASTLPSCQSALRWHYPSLTYGHEKMFSIITCAAAMVPLRPNKVLPVSRVSSTVSGSSIYTQICIHIYNIHLGLLK